MRRAASSPPMWPCTGRGLPRSPVTRSLVRSYHTIAPLPIDPPHPTLSPLSRGEEYEELPIGGMFLWHFPWGRPHWELPSALPFGVRTFLRRLVVSGGRPACSRAYPSTPAETSQSHPVIGPAPMHHCLPYQPAREGQEILRNQGDNQECKGCSKQVPRACSEGVGDEISPIRSNPRYRKEI